jgi:hypothetical protein
MQSGLELALAASRHAEAIEVWGDWTYTHAYSYRRDDFISRAILPRTWSFKHGKRDAMGIR